MTATPLEAGLSSLISPSTLWTPAHLSLSSCKPAHRRRLEGRAMGPTGAAVLATAALLVIQVSEAILPVASNCCTEVSHQISRRLLAKVKRCYIQKADGVCDLPAVILYVHHRKYCVSPNNHTLKTWMKMQKNKKNAKGNICHRKKHPHRKKRKSKMTKQRWLHKHGQKTLY
ncbi:C-C motif chemokine 28 [Macrotis lagotis]|uniref:C-C motif chemokine 28 n=1 Tax=Macrotis lagotis TaxID=92651 RepID=UPI003D680EFB